MQLFNLTAIRRVVILRDVRAKAQLAGTATNPEEGENVIKLARFGFADKFNIHCLL